MPQPAEFRRIVWAYYRKRGRHDLPWRATRDPYKILVSEVMLQQTQVERVIPFYKNFIKQFPTAKKLAAASLSDVLSVWQGLGYNRRAKLLHEAAQCVINNKRGRIPKDAAALAELPGIGTYTARAITVFAHNQPHAMIETNIRSVFLHHFFQNKKSVHDQDIIPLIKQTLDSRNPRKWYAALMDYGSHLKKTLPNPSRQSKHHTKQSPFKGSNRQLRGAIIRLLLEKPNQPVHSLARQLRADAAAVQKNLEQMRREGLLKKRGFGFAAG